MQLSDEQKKDIERRIVKAIVKGLDENKITVSDLPELSSYLLENIEHITTQEQLTAFLSDISSKWQIFVGIQAGESIPIENSVEDKNKTIQDVTDLAKDGKIDEAIDLAKTATGTQNIN